MYNFRTFYERNLKRKKYFTIRGHVIRRDKRRVKPTSLSDIVIDDL